MSLLLTVNEIKGKKLAQTIKAITKMGDIRDLTTILKKADLKVDTHDEDLAAALSLATDRFGAQAVKDILSPLLMKDDENASALTFLVRIPALQSLAHDLAQHLVAAYFCNDAHRGPHVPRRRVKKCAEIYNTLVETQLHSYVTPFMAGIIQRYSVAGFLLPLLAELSSMPLLDSYPGLDILITHIAGIAKDSFKVSPKLLRLTLAWMSILILSALLT